MMTWVFNYFTQLDWWNDVILRMYGFVERMRLQRFYTLFILSLLEALDHLFVQGVPLLICFLLYLIAYSTFLFQSVSTRLLQLRKKGPFDFIERLGPITTAI